MPKMWSDLIANWKQLGRQIWQLYFSVWILRHFIVMLTINKHWLMPATASLRNKPQNFYYSYWQTADGWQDIKFIYMPLFLHNLYLVLIEPLISCMRWKSAATVISQCMVMATTAVFVFFFGLFVVSIPLSSAAWSSVLREKHGSVRKHTRMLLTSWNLQNFGAHKFGS